MKKKTITLLVAATMISLPCSGLCAGPVSSFSVKPKSIAVLELAYEGANAWWNHGGAEQAQFSEVADISELFGTYIKAIPPKTVNSTLKKNSLGLSGDVDPKTAIRMGKLLNVNYLLTGSVTEYGVTDKSSNGKMAIAKISGRLIDTSTGEVVWADEVVHRVNLKGFGGGVDDNRLFQKVMKPCIRTLVTKMKAKVK